MWPPPLLRQRSFAVQVVAVAVIPIAYGALCGTVLGASAPGFNVLMLIATIGGVLGGFEHPGARPGLLRGLLGGALFAGALLATFESRGAPARVPLPVAVPVMAAIYAVMGMPLGALGGWLRGRSDDRRARAAATG
ncbi:MAG TPA: hypothetical protein VFK02_11410 [Kofleriaceae bacterium]|nr:hypothetical protein [Kofleriaceae bacterium]